MEEVKILELTERCIKYFQKQCYTRNRITVYKSLWRNGIISYMSQKGIESYSPSVGAEFVSTCHFHGTIRPQEREKIRSIQVLDDMLKLGYIRKRCYTPVFHALDGEVGAEMEKLTTHLTNLRRSMVTIKDYRLYLSEFLMHLNERNVKHVSAITEKDILTFVSSHPTNKVNIVSALRVLFRFWREGHIVDDRFEELFDTYKTHKPESIPSYFAANEVMRIEQSVSRNSANGKRNYAMLLLASRLGLRASDIANLQFSDIDWDKDMITLTMQKTKKVIELPLLADVGNAIIDYLRHGRPKSDSQNVFLSGNAPFGHCYEEGCGVEQNFNKAFGMYQKSFDLDESTGTQSLARCYEEGIGVKIDYKMAAKLYEKVLSGFLGNKRYTKVRVGNIYLFDLGETDKGIKYLKEAADAGSGAAFYYLGKAYGSGTGVERNSKTAVDYYQQSIDAETYPFVLTILADHYYKGDGVSRNIEKAKELYDSAARMGDDEAKEKLRKLK